MPLTAFFRHTFYAQLVLTLVGGVVAADQAPEIGIGFGGCWKLGHWTPVTVTPTEEQAAAGVRFQLVAPDGDGVPTVVESPVLRGEDAVRWHGTTRLGRVAPLVVRWTDGEQVLGGLEVETSRVAGSPSRALAATDTLVVRVGGSGGELLGAAERGAVFAAVASPADLPIHWSGYDAVDLLVVEAKHADAWRPESTRPAIAAIASWVRSGGRLVLSLGENAEELVGAGGPLASLSPGRLMSVVDLPDATPLVRYTDAEQPPDGSLRVARLSGVEGVIEAHGPGGPNELPLLIRAPLGLGEVITTTFDLDSPELARWAWRERLLERLLGTNSVSRAVGPTPRGGGRLRSSTRELTTLLRARLGSGFRGVTVTPFMAIVAATVVYLALVGPGDYFFVKRLLKRASLTWLTFSLLVAAASLAAVAVGVSSRPAGAVVNQIELVDVDTQSGAARGALWAEVYSPRGSRRGVAARSATPGGWSAAGSDTRIGWLGVPGGGLLGMQSSAGRDVGRGELRNAYLLTGTEMLGVPIRAASTKSIAARWVSTAPGVVDSTLAADRNGLVEGELVNNSGETLRGARLVYGDWAWRLGTIADGRAVLIDEGLAPIKLTTLTKTDLLGPATGGRGREIDPDRLDAAGLLRLAVFHERLGGAGYSGRELRHQRFVDLSHQLRAGRAVLLAEASGPRTRLVDPGTDRPLAEPQDATTTLFRFVLPVAPTPPDPRP